MNSQNVHVLPVAFKDIHKLSLGQEIVALGYFLNNEYKAHKCSLQENKTFSFTDKQNSSNSPACTVKFTDQNENSNNNKRTPWFRATSSSAVTSRRDPRA